MFNFANVCQRTIFWLHVFHYCFYVFIFMAFCPHFLLSTFFRFILLCFFLVSSDRRLDYWFEIVPFSNVRINCCKFPSQHWLSHVPQFIFIQLNAFKKILLRLSLWFVDCLEVCCLVSNCLKFFMLSFWYWFLIWIHCDQWTDFVWF